MFALKIFVGPLIQFVVCDSKPWPVSSTSKNFSTSTPRGRNLVFRKKSTWVCQQYMCAYNLLIFWLVDHS